MRMVILGLLAVSGAAQANVVKISSYFCKDAANVQLHRSGSGVVVKRNGKAYIVTSGHVPLHEPREAKAGEICHVVKLSDGSLYEGKLVAANFLKDMALLDVSDGKSAATNKTLARSLLDGGLSLDTEPAKLTEKDEVDLVGYAFSAMGEKTLDAPNHYDGKISKVSSTRTALDVPRVIEVNGLSEYGMSGGGLFNKRDFVGLLSHQFLRIRVGDQTVVDEHQRPKAGDKRLDEERMVSLVIPAATVRDWIDQVQAEAAGADLRLSFSSGVDSSQVATILEGLKFAERNCNHVTKHIGDKIGGHGAGMGGDGRGQALGNAPCSLEVSFDDKADYQPWPWRGRTPYNQTLKALKVKSPQYVYAFQKGDITLPTENLVGAMKLMREGYLPKLSVNAPTGAVGSILPFADYLKLADEKLKEELKKLDGKMRELAGKVERLPKEGARELWKDSNDLDRMILYSVLKEYAKPSEGRDEYLFIINERVRDDLKAWFQASLEGKTLQRWNDMTDAEKFWFVMGGRILHDNWVALTKEQRRYTWDKVFVTHHEKLMLMECVVLHSGDLKVNEELYKWSDEWDGPILDEWRKAVAGGREKALEHWKTLDYGKRLWLYNVVHGLEEKDKGLLVEFKKICPGVVGLAVDLPKK